MNVDGILHWLETLLAVLIAPVILEWYKSYIARKNSKDLYLPSIEEKADPVISPLFEKYSPQMIGYWDAENGDRTISGHSILKLSMMAEILGVDSTGKLLKSIKSESQKIPIDTFGRNIRKLKATDSRIVITHESEYSDVLSDYHKLLNIETIVNIKIYTKGSWTGILMLYFEKRKEFTDQELAHIEIQASRLDNLHNNLHK